MKQVLIVLALVLGLGSSAVFAAETGGQTAGQVKLELLKQLEKDGYLSTKLTQEAKEKYVDPKELGVPVLSGASVAAPANASSAGPSLWERYISWTNFFKVVGVVLLLVAFGSYIAKIASGLLFLIVQVPQEVYQAVFLGVTLTGTLRPELIWKSQSFYLALFGAFANIILLGWVIGTHKKLQKCLGRLLNSCIPEASAISLMGVLYFCALALAYESQTFGFFAAVCLSGALSFGIHYRPGVLNLSVREKGLGAVVYGHLAVLAAYAGLKLTGSLPTQTALFVVGLEYYCTIAMGVGFLIGASPFRQNSQRGAYVMLFALVLLASVFGYFFYDMKVIASILCCIAVLLALEWIGHLSYKSGFIFGTFMLGAALYGGSLLLESYGHYVVLHLA